LDDEGDCCETPGGLIQVLKRQKQQEIEKVKTELERLNKENAALEGDVKDLKTDPQTIEKIAREELDLTRPGEVIIKLPAAANESGTAAKSQ